MPPQHYRFFLRPPKNCYSNQATQKNTCQIFVPKKIPESKISNPEKSFDHPVTWNSEYPPGPRTSKTIPYSAASTYIAHIWEYPPPGGLPASLQSAFVAHRSTPPNLVPRGWGCRGPSNDPVSLSHNKYGTKKKWKKPRKWSVTTDWYINNFSKSQVYVAHSFRFICRNISRTIVDFVWRRHICVQFWYTNMAAGNHDQR